MPVRHYIDSRQRCIFLTFSGFLTEWEIGVGVQALWHDPEYKPEFDRFIDVYGVEGSDAGDEFVKVLAKDTSIPRTGRMALFGKEAQVIGFREVFAPNASGLDCRAFLDSAEALDWLGVQAP